MAEAATTTGTDAFAAQDGTEHPKVRSQKGRIHRKVRSSEAARGRRQFSLGEDAIARLDTVRARTGAASRSEVIRQALKVYDFLTNEETKGHRVLIQQADGTLVQLKIL